MGVVTERGHGRGRPRMRPAASAVLAVLAAAVWLVGAAAPASGQGPGSAGAQLLTLTAGGRAGALAGAYTAMTGDVDGVFYNPAGAAWLDRGVGLGYEEYVEGVVFGSLAGGLSVGRIGVSAGLVYLDAGEIEEVVPDHALDGERGRRTGATVGAVEAAVRVAVAAALSERASAGVALGVVTSDLAGVQRRGLFLDAGAQYRIVGLAVGRLGSGDLTFGGVLRNVGPAMTAGEAGYAPLPLEGRLGMAYRHRLEAGLGALVSTDLVVGVEEETVGVAVGAEAGFLPAGDGLTAVLRAGTTLGGEEHLGRLRVGGGIGIRGVFFDYTLQRYEYFGAIHRVGLRWTP